MYFPAFPWIYRPPCVIIYPIIIIINKDRRRLNISTCPSLPIAFLQRNSIVFRIVSSTEPFEIDLLRTWNTIVHIEIKITFYPRSPPIEMVSFVSEISSPLVHVRSPTLSRALRRIIIGSHIKACKTYFLIGVEVHNAKWKIHFPRTHIN